MNMSLPCAQGRADATTIGVLTPCGIDRNQAVFTTISHNIVAASDARIFCLTPPSMSMTADLNAWLIKQKIAVIIALGRPGMDAARHLKARIPVITGAVYPDQLTTHATSSVALQVDPEAAMALLKQLAPHLKRIHVVYANQQSHCEIEKLRIAAAKWQLALHAYAREAVISAYVRTYMQLLARPLNKQDAVWLCETRFSVGEHLIINQLLENAWTRKFVLVAAAAADVKMGVLLGWTPDYANLGKQLANMALKTTPQNLRIGHRVALEKAVPIINFKTAERLALLARVAQLKQPYLRAP